MTSRRQDLTGQRFSRWTVVGIGAKEKKTQKWRCVCECGKTREVASNNLKNGKSRSCGCLQAEAVRGMRFKHGMTAHPIYASWSSMKSRCLSETNEDYRHYGGRGIKVHAPWQLDFWNFWDDVASGWRPGLSLDRIDVDGNYEPGNVRWATQPQQRRNCRDTIHLDTPWGRMPLMDAAEKAGINPNILRQRYRKGFMKTDLFSARDGRRK